VKRLVVLYEDAHVIVVEKPAGLPTVPTADPARPSLVRLLEAELLAKGAGVSLGVHQRLDRDTSGIVLFAKSSEANRGLARQFEAGEVLKTYLALVARPRKTPRASWIVESRIDRVGKGRRASVAEGGALARTEFRVAGEWPLALLIEARPRTGRTHQIRVHLAESGLPILGDETYGGASPAATRGLLHAARLELRHPVTGEPLRLESALPADFGNALAALERSQARSRALRPQRPRATRRRR
jgi:RluA family pseudouridine synthase